MPGKKYTDEQNKFLLEELLTAHNCICKENFTAMEELWPGFYKGQKRSAYALFLQTMRLAKKVNIEVSIHTIPKRIRNRTRKGERIDRRSSRSKLYEQVQFIVQNEIRSAQKRIASSIMRLFENVAQDNIDLKEEIKTLVPFKNLVETSYRKELEFRGGN